MDFLRIAARVSERVAASNPEVAQAIAGLVKKTITPLLEQLNPDFGHDALASGVRGQSEGSVSFPVRPGAFDTENLNGNLLVKITLNPPVQGSGKDIAGTATSANFTVGYYFKTPKIPGSGKFMWETPAGNAEIMFDESGNPQVEDPGDLADIVDALETLTDKVVEAPPEGARSYTRDPELRKQQREINQVNLQNKEELEREKSQSKARQEQREADSATHGSVEAFVQYMDDQDEDEFGPADLQKLLNTMYNDQASREVARGEIQKALTDEGLEWKPGKRTLSSDLVIAARITQS